MVYIPVVSYYCCWFFIIIIIINEFIKEDETWGLLLLFGKDLTHSLPIDGDSGTVFYYEGIDWFPQSWVNWCLTVLGGDYQKSFII